MKILIILEKEKVEECDGGCDGGCDGPGFGMGEVTIGGPDRFDLGFDMAPFTQAGVGRKKRKVKLRKRKHGRNKV